MAQLRTIEGSNAGEVFPLHGESLILGRHPECDIVLDSGAVSRQHARIVRLGDAFFIEDLDSRNGTYVNGQQIRERRPLNDQDRITLCDIVMLFHDDVPQAARLRTAPPRRAAPARSARPPRG